MIGFGRWKRTLFGCMVLYHIPEGTPIMEQATPNNKAQPGWMKERLVQPNEGLAYNEDALIWQPNEKLYCFMGSGFGHGFALGKNPLYVWVEKKHVLMVQTRIGRCQPQNSPKRVFDPVSNYYNEEWLNAYIEQHEKPAN